MTEIMIFVGLMAIMFLVYDLIDKSLQKRSSNKERRQETKKR